MTFGEIFNIRGFWGEVRPEDFLDIAIVSFALSVILGWLKRRSTRPILLTAVIVTAVYLLARWLNLYLTLQVFQVGLVILLIATLLAYRDDIRRGFDRLASGHLFRRPHTADGANVAITTLADAAFELAERRMGALMVIHGSETLDRHLHGGWEVSGKLSLPLLMSIFDVHTPAHDGAVIIDEQWRIDRVGVHLPLSANLGKVQGGGTRHAAALGMVEESDAFVIMVSEEKGAVRVAEAGEIATVSTQEELVAKLTEFHSRHCAVPRRRQRAWSIRDFDAKCVGVGLAALLWFALAAPSQPVQQSYDVRVELIGMPEDWQIVSGPMPAQVTVTLVGPEHAFRQLDGDSLRLALDLSDARTGTNTLETDKGRLNLPHALRPIRIDSQSVFVELKSDAAPPQP